MWKWFGGGVSSNKNLPPLNTWYYYHNSNDAYQSASMFDLTYGGFRVWIVCSSPRQCRDFPTMKEAKEWAVNQVLIVRG